jgi:putative ubiquitin-RnfH superfamily antitoxin RatB of RatAB toxin-antitoxin module
VSGPRKRCLVAYATRERQYMWTVELDAAASVADALAAARVAAGAAAAAVPWEQAAVGNYGEPCARSAACADGDRIELYRPLTRDPRSARRARVARERRGR